MLELRPMLLAGQCEAKRLKQRFALSAGCSLDRRRPCGPSGVVPRLGRQESRGHVAKLAIFDHRLERALRDPPPEFCLVKPCEIATHRLPEFLAAHAHDAKPW